MFDEALFSTMEQLLQPGKGILAADESVSTIGKRFEAIGVENNEANRRDYRLLLATTPGLEEHINGVILFEETFEHKDKTGKSIPALFAAKGIVPGIKVDKGLIPLVNTDGEKTTQGLDGLQERLKTYKALGAGFAKWRCVYQITEHTPSQAAIKVNANLLAQYAAICQAEGIVPIVEPEILMDGDHAIETCAHVASMVLQEVFNALYMHQIVLECIVLKPSMVTCGKGTKPFSTPAEVAELTLSIFRSHVPVAVQTINFLSGGQSETQATENLQAMNAEGHQPWLLSFSYGRALQEDCLKTWAGKKENIKAAQAVLLKRAKLNGLAAVGKYTADMES